MTDLNTFRVFTMVGQTNSFTKAAKSLGVTRSAVAKAIARLEQQTDTRLFQRTTRTVALTHEGQTLYARAHETIKELEAALDDMAHRREEPSGLLRLSAPDGFGKSKIMPVLMQFLTRWPKLEADLTFVERQVDVVAEGFDLSFQPGVVVTSKELIARTISRHSVYFCASPMYLEQHGTPQTPDTLKRHSCLQLLQGSSVRPWTMNTAPHQIVSFEPEGRARFNNCSAVLEAAVAGLGISQLPEYVVAQAIEEGKLKRILPEAEPDPVPIVALYPTRKQLTPKVRLFLNALLREMKHSG